MQTYYFTTALIFALLSVYCMLYVLSYSDQTCIKNDTSEVAKKKAADKAAADAAAEKDKAALAAKFPPKKEEAAADAGAARLLSSMFM